MASNVVRGFPQCYSDGFCRIRAGFDGKDEFVALAMAVSTSRYCESGRRAAGMVGLFEHLAERCWDSGSGPRPVNYGEAWYRLLQSAVFSELRSRLAAAGGIALDLVAGRMRDIYGRMLAQHFLAVFPDPSTGEDVFPDENDDLDCDDQCLIVCFCSFFLIHSQNVGPNLVCGRQNWKIIQK